MDNAYQENLYIRGIRVDPSVVAEEDYFARLPMVRNLSGMGGIQIRKPGTFFVGEN